MKQSELDLNDRLSAFKADRLMDAWNARNAAELARTDLDARALGTLEWVPPSGMVCAGPYGPDSRPLGYGDKISCGAPIPADEFSGDMGEVRHYGLNVCRPFDEAHMIESACPRTPPGATLVFDRYDRRFWPEVATPPNHGHGARCGCFFFAPNWDLSLVEPEIQGRRRMTAMVLSNGMRVIVHSASTGLVSPQDCPWCAGTGRIICDQDSLGGQREARVSPSHAAGGYAEWQRLSSVGIYAMYGEPATTERE